MAEPIRILHVFGTTNLGGAESRVMDLYRAIDRTKVQFDFVTHTGRDGHFDQEIKRMGGRIFHVPPFRVYNILSYRRAFRRLFQEHPEFRMVHGHMTSTASVYLPVAKKSGVQTTIAHARSAGVDKGVKGYVTKLLRKNLYKKADILFACSRLAGQAVFGEKAWKSGRVKFVPNAVDAAKYRYKEALREQVRKELGLENKWVIGHVGSFRYAKNHEYLLKVFEAVKIMSGERNPLKEPNCPMEPVLLLLGDGELIENIKQQAVQMGLSQSVFFLGNREDVWKYYQAMDFVVFPSRYEGMPGTIVEAQVSGLKCLISDRISEDTIFTDLVKQKSIDIAPEKWAKDVLKERMYDRKDSYEQAVEAGFDVTGQARQMLKFYETGVWE